MIRAAALLLAATLAGCGHVPFSSCPAGLHKAPVVELFFGRNIGASEGVSDADWKDFVDSEIASRLPKGFTVAAAEGGWRGPDGAIVRERAFRLTVVDPDEAVIAAIRAAYKVRFRQDSVLEVEEQACVGF